MRTSALIVAPVLPLAALIGVSLLLRVLTDGPTLLDALGAYVMYRCGVAFVRLQCAPIYPRERYYGEADVAPEEPERRSHERRFAAGSTALTAASAAVVSAIVFRGQWAPLMGLLAGLAVEMRRRWPGLDASTAAALETSLEGRYILYLRSFEQSRASIAVVTLRAARPDTVIMIVSPRRIEARSPFWYAVSVLLPWDFNRLHLWSTADEEWDRIISSCMARSLGIVIDCAGLSSDYHDDGLTTEAGISTAFAADHPTAYILGPGQSLRGVFPVPALIRAGSSWWWLLRNHRALVARIRDVTRRTLPPAETAYLKAFYDRFHARWSDAMISDRNHATRQGWADPAPLLKMRRSSRSRVVVQQITPKKDELP